MNTIIVIASLVLLSVFTGSSASARGQLPPPPPYFSGGNAGDWLGSGPLFTSDEPWGIDFPDEWGGSGNDGNGSGDGGGTDLLGDGFSGFFGPGGARQDTIGVNFGCNKCQKPSMTGGCRDDCDCKGWIGIVTENPQLGRCAPGIISDERNRCGFHGGGCWHYK